MSRSSRRKEKYRINGEPSLDYCNEGTSARTRPLSYEDIMLRRKNKKEAGKVQAGCGKDDNKEKIDEKAADGLVSEKDRHHISISGGSRHVLEDSLRVSSRRKEGMSSIIVQSKLVQDRAKGSRDDPESKLKSELTKNLSRDHARGGKYDRHVDNRKTSDRLDHDSKSLSGKQHSRDLLRKDISAEKTSRKSEKERGRKENIDNDDRQVTKRRNVHQSRHDYENESKERHSRGFIGTDNYRESHRGQPEKENKKKHQEEDKEKIGDRDGVKKLDLRTSKNLEFSDRKEKDSIRMDYQESRPNRKRSRSREHDNDRGRRPPSLSPRVHKHTTLGGQEHGGSSSVSSKDRYHRSHTDVERKRLSSNGSHSNYKRYSGSSSGLGGYSPRKRKTEAAARTPSPKNWSPENKTAAWDLQPDGKDCNTTMPVVSDMQTSQIPSLNAYESSYVIPDISVPVKPVSILQYTSQILAVDSVQLTQATRPMRRLYVENLPASASEKTLMECINNFLLSSGVNHVQGALPCISCMIHKEKGQALLEFLTPEDASAALSLDGISFSGSIIKIRRPKDFVEVITGVPNKSMEATNMISDTVEDSSHKIFIGGISKGISSKRLMEIARAFGPLKAFHFEHNADIDAPCAFLEYVDHLVTVKACAALNGMKLGGQVLTVVQAIPDAPQMGNASFPPPYGIPEHAKPLLDKPTEILKLKNMLDADEISSLSEADIEELLEDIRLECSRFGTVKAVNIVKNSSNSPTTEMFAAGDGSGSAMDHSSNREVTGESASYELEVLDLSDPFSISTEPDDTDKATVSNGHSNEKPEVNVLEEETCERIPGNGDLAVKDAAYHEDSSLISEEYANSLDISTNDLVGDDKIADANPIGSFETQNKVNVEEDSILEEDNMRLANSSKLETDEKKESDVTEKGDNKEEIANSNDVFEAGCVLVEFKRAEASCMAAHCLHGRLFDDRVVSVEYVTPDLYQKRFPK